MSKDLLRVEAKSKISSFVGDYKASSDKEISDNLHQLLNNLNFSDQSVVGIYAPLVDEVQWTLSFKESDFIYAFPQISSDKSMQYKKIDFAYIHDESFNYKCRTKALVVEPEVVIVPGLGFSEQGLRLGRGQGYYDRYLEHSKAIKIGICYEELIQSELPGEKHDVLMDFIVTQSKVRKIN